MIRHFEPLIIPGLLQTLDYARSSIRSGPLELDREEIERRVEVRMARQEILTHPDRPRLWVVTDEASIRRQVGGPLVMRAQLQHLAEATEQGKTTVQVVPFTAGAHAGTTGPFIILGFAEPTDPDVVYVETVPEGLYLDEAPDVARFTIAFERLLATALSPDDSVSLIRRAAKDLD